MQVPGNLSLDILLPLVTSRRYLVNLSLTLRSSPARYATLRLNTSLLQTPNSVQQVRCPTPVGLRCALIPSLQIEDTSV